MITGLQDRYLNSIRKEHVLATFFLINGFQMKGRVNAFDQFTVIIDSDGKQQLLYKHAISTIMPVRPIDLATLMDEEEKEE